MKTPTTTTPPWQDRGRRWRQLPAGEKLRLRWEAIPEDVAQSMAFEGEPVSLEVLREAHARIGPANFAG